MDELSNSHILDVNMAAYHENIYKMNKTFQTEPRSSQKGQTKETRMKGSYTWILKNVNQPL